MATKQKKPGMLKRLFSSKKLDVSGISEEDKKKFQRSKSMDSSMMRPPSTSDDTEGAKKSQKKAGESSSGKQGQQPKNKTSAAGPSKSREAGKDRQNGQKPRTKPREEGGLTRKRGEGGGGSLKRRKEKKDKKPIHVNAGDKIDYPCTPEIILEHHKLKAFLNPTEEWLVVELGEFECLIDNMDIIKIMAKHSKFFEVEPDELVEEFFEFVDDVPSYDEVVNYDVWQEFRDKKYLC